MDKVQLKLLVKGNSNLQIAEQLGVAERTIVFHITNILQKLGADTRQEAAAWVVKYIPDISDIE